MGNFPNRKYHFRKSRLRCVVDTNTLTGVREMPTDQELRQAIAAVVLQKYPDRGLKGFAQDAGIPYDRVRDHISGTTNWKVADLLAYCQALGVTFDDLIRVRDAFPSTHPKD